MDKTLGYYKRLPYTLYAEPVRDSDGSRYWTAEYVELRGCKTDGATEAEAIANLHELFDEYISIRLKDKIEILEPVRPPIQPIEEIVIFRKERVRQPFPSDIEGTQQTKGEIKPETRSITYEEMAA